MWSLGIDVAKQTHNATLLDDRGAVVFRNFSFPHSQEGFDSLLQKLRATGKHADDILAGMEATGRYWMTLRQRLADAGYVAHVINPVITAARRNVYVRGVKTDSADSHLIASLLRDQNLKVSAIPQQQVQRLRNFTRQRFDSMQKATAEKLKLLDLLHLVFPEYPSLFSKVFGAASRAVLENFPSAADLANANTQKLTRIIQKASRGRLGREQALKIKNAAKNSFAFPLNTDSLGVQIRFTVEQLNLLIDQIARLDRLIASIFPTYQWILRSAPGVGKVWAPTILAEILPVFHPELKNGAKKFVAIAGIDARPDESGQVKGKRKISKRGSKYLRTAVIQATETAVFLKKDPVLKDVYDRQRSRGKHHLVALSHAGHKLLHIIFAILRDQKPYTPILPKQESAQCA